MTNVMIYGYPVCAYIVTYTYLLCAYYKQLDLTRVMSVPSSIYTYIVIYLWGYGDVNILRLNNV